MLCENIKAIRKSKGLSQEELAIKLNVVRQTISKWEKGLSVPDADMLVQLAALLQGTVPLGLLLAARVLHFVFLQGLLHLCLPLVPGQAAVFTRLAPQVVVMKRTAWDTALAIAFFLCAALYQLYKTCQSSYNNTIPAAHRSRADGPR